MIHFIDDCLLKSLCRFSDVIDAQSFCVPTTICLRSLGQFYARNATRSNDAACGAFTVCPAGTQVAEYESASYHP